MSGDPRVHAAVYVSCSEQSARERESCAVQESVSVSVWVCLAGEGGLSW